MLNVVYALQYYKDIPTNHTAMTITSQTPQIERVLHTTINRDTVAKILNYRNFTGFYNAEMIGEVEVTESDYVRIEVQELHTVWIPLGEWTQLEREMGLIAIVQAQAEFGIESNAEPPTVDEVVDIQETDDGKYLIFTAIDDNNELYEWTEPASMPSDPVGVVWESCYTGYTENLVSGHRYSFYLTATRVVVSNSPGSRHGRPDKHYRAIVDDLGNRPGDDFVESPMQNIHGWMTGEF